MKRTDEINDIQNIVSESIRILHALEETDASERAAELGLISRGFGRYSKSETGPISHKTVDGRLVPAHVQSREKKKKTVEPEIPVPKQKAEPKKSITPPKQAPRKVGITDIQKVRGNKPLYSFKYNGRAGRITLTGNELQAFQRGLMSLTKIIATRIKNKEIEKYRGLAPSIKKQIKALQAKELEKQVKSQTKSEK